MGGEPPPLTCRPDASGRRSAGLSLAWIFRVSACLCWVIPPCGYDVAPEIARVGRVLGALHAFDPDEEALAIQGRR
jgi:hypothetical protein